MDEKIIKKNAVPVIAAMITALAFSFTGLPMDGNTSVEKMSDVYNGLGCMSLLAWILLLILYVKGWEGYRKYRNWQAHVLAVIFSAGMLLGTSYFTNGSWDFLFGAKKQILISAGCFIGFYIIFARRNHITSSSLAGIRPQAFRKNSISGILQK